MIWSNIHLGGRTPFHRDVLWKVERGATEMFCVRSVLGRPLIAWASMRPRDASLSDSCTADYCSFFRLEFVM